ncbi:MAG: sulfite exporter TauE/SafE family protein [Treponema sp.]|jgi:uncharacterized membrane protein YfcA|nr:sulfite exporter TauE/SafE family protein [Treponema sp.]
MSNLPFAFESWQWTVLIVTALLIGMGKTGLSGINTVMVPVMALVFGAKESTGIVLPMYCFADLLAIFSYRKDVAWKHIARLLPWTLSGFAAALLVDYFIPVRLFKILIAVSILAGLIVMVWNDLRKARQRIEGREILVPSGWWFAAGFGILGGFSTLIGNAAGPVMAIFMLSMQLPKISYVGTTAWFFVIVNYLKLPLQHFVWHNIGKKGLILDAMMFPVIILGALLGVFLVKRIPEKQFRILIYLLTLVSATLLFL